MKLINTVTNTMKLGLGKAKLFTKRNSPELLLAGSIAAVGLTIGLTIKATLKLEDTIRPHNENINLLKEKIKRSEDPHEPVVEDVDILRKEIAKEYKKVVIDIAKLYAPSAITFTLFMAASITSHKIMKGRNLALASAYGLLNKSFESYRERVKAKVGADVEDKIFRNVQTNKELVTKVDENGNVIETMEDVEKANHDQEDLFTYLFDESNPNWEKQTSLNLELLLGRQKYLNQKFVAQGYLFLSDVYEFLGISDVSLPKEKLQASKMLGWVYDPSDNTLDNWVSFGISDKNGNLTPEVIAAIKQGQRSFWLSFNVDGDILNNTKGSRPFMKYVRG